MDAATPSAEQQIRCLGDLQRLELKPGDHFVLMVPGRMKLGVINASPGL